MPLIKANQPGTNRATMRGGNGGGALALDLCDLREQAEFMIAAAHREADEIRSAAEAEASKIVASADDRGYQAGLERGIAEGRKQGEADARVDVTASFDERLSALTDAWQAALDRWEERFSSMLLDAREDVLLFAFELARKVVLRTPVVDPGVVYDQVAEALTLLCRPTSVTIEVHPDDRALVDEMLPVLLERVTRCEHANLRENEAITRGGCVVRTQEGVIDATLEKQIERIAETLLPVTGAGPAADTDVDPEPIP